MTADDAGHGNVVRLTTTPRPVIRCVGGDLPREVDDAEAALIRVEAPVYSRGQLLVTPALASVPASDGREFLSPRLRVISTVWLVEKLTSIAQFERYNVRSGSWTAIDCPRAVAQTLIEREKWSLRPLAGVLAAPTLRGDGSLIEDEGYDERSRLILDFRGADFPPVPPDSNHDDASAALKELEEAFSTFDVVADVDRAVIVSAVLTALVRRSLPTAPLHAVTAHVAGSGKSLVADLVSLIATGRICPVISGGHTAEELEKRLGAMYLQGDPIISLDNLDRPLAGDFLAQALTQQAVKVRPLGRSTIYEMPTGAMMLATGNNLRVAGDLTRRCLLARLDPDCSEPELRVFTRDAREYVCQNRGRLVRSALTIMRAYAVAGRQAALSPLGSFENWSLMVREALVWAGAADPVLSLESARAGDPERENLRAMMWAWGAALQDRRTTAAEAIAAAFQHQSALREAMLAVASDRGSVDVRRLGKWLSKVAGRRLDGARFFQDGQRHGSALWRLAGFEGLTG